MGRTTTLALLFLFCLAAGSAEALVGDRFASFGLDGSFRTVNAATVNYDFPAFFDDRPGDGISQTLLRLELGGQPADWFTYEIHGVQDLNTTTAPSGGLSGAGLFSSSGTGIRYRALDATWAWAEEGQVRAALMLDRLNMKFRLSFADITIGRQAVTFGKAYFWNPLDVFLAFDPRSFDRDYKAGVDALRIDLPFGDYSGLTLVGALGRKVNVWNNYEDDAIAQVSWTGSAIILRAYTNLADWDLAIQGGKLYGAYQVGAAFSGELGPIAIRGEGAYFIADEDDSLPFMFDEARFRDHAQVVLGIGHRFDFSLNLEMEYLYNGAGDANNKEASLLRMSSGGSYHLGEHMIGFVASYEILPILQGSFAWIFSASDLSSLIQPGFVLSVSNESDLLFGAMLGLGARPTNEGLQSEFGTYPNIYYFEYKYYF
ncbi:MAG: hypothetical protein JRF33_20215 [Deltaproteobacteria bacterium]|nr:hypothetical protein [Deltaproteobacteria bacterium]